MDRPAKFVCNVYRVFHKLCDKNIRFGTGFQCTDLVGEPHDTRGCSRNSANQVIQRHSHGQILRHDRQQRMDLRPIDTEPDDIRTDDIRPEILRKGCFHNLIAVVDPAAGAVQQDTLFPARVNVIRYVVRAA